MTLEKKDLDVLRILVQKELEHLQKDQKNLMISNSPFLTKVVDDDSDLDFLKSEKLYEEFLGNLLQKLKQ